MIAQMSENKRPKPFVSFAIFCEIPARFFYVPRS